MVSVNSLEKRETLDTSHCAGRQAGKLRKMRHERQSADSDGLGMNVRTLAIVAVILMLMLFAVHCTWVTSNAYSSPSIVLASYSGG